MRIFKNRDYIENSMISASKKHLTADCDYHGHDFFEIELILDGSAEYEIDGVPYHACPDTLFVMNPSHIHALRKVDLSLINIMFIPEERDASTDITAWLLSQPSHFILDGETSRFLRLLFSEIVETHEAHPTYAMQLLECAIRKLSIQYPAPLYSNKAARYVQKALLFVHGSFGAEATLEAAADYVGLSPAYFSDLFHREVGFTFKTYLDTVRLAYAAKLLRYTALSVKEIHFRAGFPDYANFTKRFKLRYGASPTAYRKLKKVP